VFDWGFKIESWVSLMIIVIIARFVTARACALAYVLKCRII